MLGVFAEFERANIQERLRTGLRRAKAEGKKLRRPRITKDLETKILADLNAPGRIEGVRKIAKQFGVDPGTVQRIGRRECRDAPRQSRGQSSPQNDLSVFEFGSPWRTKLQVGIFDIVRPRDGGTCPFNLTHHPALTLPCGLADGCPIGLMLVAKPFAEATLYTAAYAFEQSVDWRRAVFG
jgi:hypothetical protein